MDKAEQTARNAAAADYIDKFAARRERIGGTCDASTKDLMLDTYLEGWAACHRYFGYGNERDYESSASEGVER